MIINNLIKTYPNGYTALKGVSFETPDSGLICITGESGSGKTTLLNCIFGAEECEGKIVISGETMTKKNREEIRRRYMTMIYQDYRLIEDMTAEDNLRLAADAVGISLSGYDILNALKRVGLKEEYSKRRVSAMSGGEKQRVGIARAVIQQSRILLADEPTGNLDSKNSRAIFKLLKELSKEILIIAVTHNAALASEFADYRIELSDGEILKSDLESIVSDKSTAIGTEKIIVPQRRTRISPKMFFTLMRKSAKGRIMSALLSAFGVLFLTAAFITSSFLMTNTDSVFNGNAKARAESPVIIGGGFAFSPNITASADGEKFYVFSDASERFKLDWSENANLDGIYIKSARGDVTKYVVECGDVSKLGVTLLVGRNAENYDEIVINESIAYDLLSFGEYEGRRIASYGDVIGLKRGGLTVVGVAQAAFGLYGGEYRNATNRDFLNADDNTRERMRATQSLLSENVLSAINYVKEGYSEHTRDTIDSINAYVRKRTVRLKSNDAAASAYNVYDGGEYSLIGGGKGNAAPASDEIIVSNELYRQYIMINGMPSEPFIQAFDVGDMLHTLKVIGYADKLYVSSETAELFRNDSAEIFSAAAISSKADKRLKTNIRESLEEHAPYGAAVSIESPFTYNLNETVSSIIDYRALFAAAFAVSGALLILFGFLSVYIVMRQRRGDILIMRSVNMGADALGAVYAAAFTARGVIQIALAYACYAAAVFGLNGLIKSSSLVLFDLLFIETMPSLLISAAVILTSLFFAALYLSSLFNKTIGRKMKN